MVLFDGVCGVGSRGGGASGVCGGWDSEDLPKQSQSGKNEAEESYENDIEGDGQGSVDGDEKNKSEEDEYEDKQEELGEESKKEDNNTSPMGRELISKSQHEAFKTISIDMFHVAMIIDHPAKLTGDFIIKCQLGKPFDEFRNIMRNENIYVLFKKSYFGYFLELPEDHTVHFQISMVEHLWIVPIKQELGMTSFITLGFVDTIADQTVELIKKELARATTIKRSIRQGHPSVEALHYQTTIKNLDDSSWGVAGGFNIGGRHANATASL
ncbi:hypothetical protein FXO38_23775 [Capsicum annuum]|nr:hypothetical protein FXO38_23775 [Capsicum annuum]